MSTVSVQVSCSFAKITFFPDVHYILFCCLINSGFGVFLYVCGFVLVEFFFPSGNSKKQNSVMAKLTLN